MSATNAAGYDGPRESIVKLRRMLAETRPTLSDIVDGYALVGNSTRLSILWLIHRSPQGELCPCDLADILGISVPGVSQQLQRLRRGKLVRNRRAGKAIYYALTDSGAAVAEKSCRVDTAPTDAPLGADF